MKNDVHAWFMAYSGCLKDGIRLTITQDYGKKAYLGEYRWENGNGINVRWQLEKIKDTQHFTGYETKQDVEDAVNQSFEYCFSVREHINEINKF